MMSLLARCAGSVFIAACATACGPSTFRLRPATEDTTPVLARPVTIVHKPLVEGTTARITERISVELRITVHAPGKPDRSADLRIGSTIVKEETALATKPGEGAALRVAYDDVFAETNIAGRSRRAESPLAHRSYVIRVINGSLDALHPDGTAPSLEETKALRLVYRPLTAKPKVAPKPAAELEIGKRLPEWEHRLGTMLGVNSVSDVKTGDVQVTLLGVRERETDKAVFEATVSTEVDTKEKTPLHLHTLLRGRWVVSVDDGWNQQLLLGGPTSVSGTMPEGTIEGSGTTRVLSTWEYVKKK